jgi:hypothetical protein
MAEVDNRQHQRAARDVHHEDERHIRDNHNHNHNHNNVGRDDDDDDDDEASEEGDDWVPSLLDDNDNDDAQNVEDHIDGDGNDDDDDDDDEHQHRPHPPPLANAALNDRMTEMAARRRDAQEVHNRRSKHKFLTYVLCSLGGAILHTYWALWTRHQFYLSVVYLTSSKFAYVTMGNACICLTVLLFQAIIWMTLGELRNAEQEAIGEGLRWGLMETGLAITIFRQEVDRHMALLFLTLVLAKSLHWAAEFRGLYVQQTEMMHAHDDLQEYVLHPDDDDNDDEGEDDDARHDANHHKDKPLVTMKWILGLLRGFKAQFGFLCLTYGLLFLDLWAVVYCATVCARLGPSAHILFGFEAAILFMSATHTLATHGAHWYDTAFYTSRHKTWHGRGTITFSVELALEGCKFVFYLIFFAIVFTYYGMPINIFRDLYMSYVTLKRKILSFVKYRQLTTNMNARFETVSTQAELEECGGRTCIICRDDITIGNPSSHNSNPGKKLPCSHVFHFYCLREWLQQQQSCPTCRSEIPASWSKAKKLAAEERAAAATITATDADAANNQEEVEVADVTGASAAENADTSMGTTTTPADDDESGDAEQTQEQTKKENIIFSTPTKPASVELPSPLCSPVAEEDDHVPSASTTLEEHHQLVTQETSISIKAHPPSREWLWAEDDDEEEDGTENWEEQDPFPCLYRVTAAEGATVYENMNNGEHRSWLVVRCVASQKVILCTRMEWMQGGTVVTNITTTSTTTDNTNTTRKELELSSQMMLRMPDGWVAESTLERIPIPLSGLLDAAGPVSSSSTKTD